MTEEILDSVRSKYGAVAQSTLSSNNEGVKAVAEAFTEGRSALIRAVSARGWFRRLE